MASRHLNLASHLTPITELTNYKIEDGDPDPRGWTVVTSDGSRLGTVDDLVVDTNAMKVRHLVVDVDGSSGLGTNSDHVLLDADDVDLRHDRREVFARSYTGTGVGSTAGSSAHGAGYGTERDTTIERDRATMTRSEEELRIGKREVNRGEAVVAKHVETEHVSQPVTRRREELVVERRPVEAGRAGDATIGDDEMRIPLMEEEVIVEKRPVVREEIVVGKRIVEERDTVEADVRREEVDIQERGTDPSLRDHAMRKRNR